MGSPLAKPDLYRIERSEFDKISRFAYDKFGVLLGPGKEELVTARLAPKLRKLGLPNFGAYLTHVERDPSGLAMLEMIDALTTNHTSFFREEQHFRFLTGPALDLLRKTPSPTIWSAACSSGEEPYSIVMWLNEQAPDVAQRLRVLATDISTKVLAAAQKGEYPTERVDSMPRPVRLKYFENASSGVTVNRDVRARVEFRRLNLIEPIRMHQKFPVIFCRNVMIYFDARTQERLIAQLADFLLPGGYLFVGHSESLSSLKQPLKYVQPAVYRQMAGLKT